MRSKPSNPVLAPVWRGLLLLTVPILLGAGGGLFFFPDWARPLWPWEIGPFNAAFLGAFYLSAGAGIALLVGIGRWHPARVVLPMIFAFTALLLLYSLLELRQFRFERWTTYGWFIIYLALPVISGLALYRYRSQPLPYAHETPARWRPWLLGLAGLFGLYGMAMFLLPTVVGAHWPWPIDAFHGRAYSVMFTAAAIGWLGLVQWSAPAERLTLGVAASAIGLFAIFGVAIVDARQGTVAWGSPGVWLWLALFGVEFAAGLAVIWWSSARSEAAEAPLPGARR